MLILSDQLKNISCNRKGFTDKDIMIGYNKCFNEFLLIKTHLLPTIYIF